MEKYTEGQQITDRATHRKTVKRQIRHGLKSYIYNRTNPHERRPFKVGQRDDFPRFLYDGDSDAESTLPYAHTWKKISVFSRCGTSNGRGFTLCHVQIYVNHDSREIQGLISGCNQRRACGQELLRKTRPYTRLHYSKTGGQERRTSKSDFVTNRRTDRKVAYGVACPRLKLELIHQIENRGEEKLINSILGMKEHVSKKRRL